MRLRLIVPVLSQPEFDDAVEEQRDDEHGGDDVQLGLDAEDVAVAERQRVAQALENAVGGEGGLLFIGEQHPEQS